MQAILQATFSGRVDRKTYAIYTGVYLAIFGVIAASLPDFPRNVLLPPLWILFLGMPRLRDIGWSPWWALTPVGAGVLTGVIAVVERRATGADPGVYGPVASGASLLIILTTLVLMIGLAIKKGDGSETLEVFD